MQHLEPAKHRCPRFAAAPATTGIAQQHPTWPPLPEDPIIERVTEIVRNQHIHPRLSQYNAFTQDPQSPTAILVHTSHPAPPHTLSQTIRHTFVETLSTRPTRTSLNILNIYSPPNDHLRTIEPPF
ncbi:hypothetical protein HPB48_010433 [Haemaphysalis longicornis]|uniref:Uncharacterized protein n=1 Tax=Haemaphysalis longicornis TaxID=44386 RepID=A0A9J6GUK0_HAELO|nr:hypothetical protein HPB48_010433 [Haemaphysalis longicornis]